MAVAYYPRLLCLCLASFFIFHLASATLVSQLSPWMLRRLATVRPRLATHILFAWRLLPPAFALFIVAALCVPNYLLLEKLKPEQVGWFCAVAALATMTVGLWALARSAHACIRARNFATRLRRERVIIAGALPVVVVDQTAPLLALTGLLSPRAVISSAVVQRLAPDQLAMALRHERAHWTSRDNLKRLLLLLTPDPLPGYSAFARLDRAWERLSEWAADDQAAGGDPGQSLALAAALVCVARMGASGRPSPLATSLVEQGDDLAARVHRLTGFSAPPASNPLRLVPWAAAATLATAAAILSAAFQPATQHFVHEALERLVH